MTCGADRYGYRHEDKKRITVGTEGQTVIRERRYLQMAITTKFC